MSKYNTISLTTILSSPRQIKPQLYNQMICELKSPLQQQSFALTSENLGNSYCVQKIPKRPNIPPAPSKSPRVYFQSNEFTRTYQSISVDFHENKKSAETVRNDLNQTIVSPLENIVNLKEQSSFSIFGQEMNSILQRNSQAENLLPCRSKNIKRKPIFYQEKDHKRLKTPQEVIFTLRKIQQIDLAFFLQFMSVLQEEFIQIFNGKDLTQKQFKQIFQRLSLQTQYTPQVFQANQLYSKILQRLRSKNSGQIVAKMFKSQTSDEMLGQLQLQRIFQGLSRIQRIINNFLLQQHSLQKLTTVFQFIQDNFRYQKSFKAQLQKLYDLLSLKLSTVGIQLIWSGCGRKLLTKSEFIESLTLNDYVVRQFEKCQQHLLAKGFRRNEA